MQYDLPAHDELEVSLFGPGVGECVVIHIGHGSWIIIDSCVDENSIPIALSYLEKIGVNPERAVKFIVISHWHDDHIQGLSEVVRRCMNAKIIYSAALLKKEFLTLVDVMNDPTLVIDRGKSGLKEMASVVGTLHRRKTNSSVTIDLVPAMADKRLFSNQDVEVWTLSPSNRDFNNALCEFGTMTDKLSTDYRGVVPAPTENRNAVAMWIRFGEMNIILGADLEESGSVESGWSAIVHSTGRPQGKANIFKVPHHGSSTGHCEDVATQILDQPISILTAYRRSKIPKEMDLSRIVGFSESVYLTTSASGKKTRRNHSVDKLFKSTVSNRMVLGGKVGHIRLRGRESIAVELAGPAEKVA